MDKENTIMDTHRFANNRDMILYFLRGSKRYFVMSACFAALVSLCDMLSPRLITYTVDELIEPGTAGNAALPILSALVRMAGGAEYLRTHLWMMAVAAAVLGLAAALARYLFRSINARGAEVLTERIRCELFENLMSRPCAWYEANQTGDLIQRCTSDVQTIKRFVSEQLVQLVNILILIVLAISFMAAIHPWITLGAAAFIPAILAYSLIFHKKVGQAFMKADEEEGHLSAIAQENLTGVRVVRAFGRERYERARFEKQNEYYTGLWIDINRLFAVYFAVGNLFMGLQLLVVIVPGAAACIGGSITTGQYIALVAYNAMLTWPTRQLGRVITEMSKAGVSIDRLRYIMNAGPETGPQEALRPPMERDITFEHVRFSYENEPQPESEPGAANEPQTARASGASNVSAAVTDGALSDISCTIRAGSTVGILGGTGSGKSTLIYLLEKLYDLPADGSRGRITIGDVDIREIDTAYLRSQIGLVMQEPFLFSRTLAENIAITQNSQTGQASQHRPDMARVRRAARTACIDEAIDSFTAGYDTLVGERGVTLSGGQKQRTAIARALMQEHPILIFDDSLSAVDAETDQKIRAALRKHTGGSTVILIAHRITTLMHADQIIVLDHGRIREMGSHAQLLEAGGLYRRIYDLQTQGLEADEPTEAPPDDETKAPMDAPGKEQTKDATEGGGV